MEKNNIWPSILIVLLLAILVGGIFQLSRKKSDIVATPSFDGSAIQYVYQKNTILNVDPIDGYSNSVKMQFFIGNVANDETKEFFSLTANQQFTSATFNGQTLMVTETPTGNPNIGTLTEVGLQGNIVGNRNISEYRHPIFNTDGTLQARVEFTPNPKPADGELIEFFKDLVVERVSDNSIIARYATDSTKRPNAYFTPLAFSPQNKGIYYIDWPSAPQEAAAPYSIIFQPFNGQRQVVFSNTSTENPVTTTFGYLGFYPEQKQVLTWQQVGAYDGTGKQQIVRYDIPTKTFHKIEVPCEPMKQYANPPSLDVRCITTLNEVIVYNLMTGAIVSRSKSFSSDSSATDITFSPDKTLLKYSTISTNQNPKKVSSNLVYDVESQMNVTSDYLFDITNGVSKLLFTSEKSVVNQQIGEVTYSFLGFIK